MAAPWVAGAQARIIGELHGQQTVNVMHFATNESIEDEGALDTLLLQLATAIGECVIDALLPAVSSDWTFIKSDAKRVYPTASDPILFTAPAASVGELSPCSVSFKASLLSVRTGGGGKRGRGRNFLPPPGESEVANSAMDAPTLALIAAFALCVAGKFMGASPTSDWRFGIFSRTGAGGVFSGWDANFRVATSLNPVADIAVMRSRRKGHGA